LKPSFYKFGTKIVKVHYLLVYIFNVFWWVREGQALLVFCDGIERWKKPNVLDRALAFFSLCTTVGGMASKGLRANHLSRYTES